MARAAAVAALASLAAAGTAWVGPRPSVAAAQAAVAGRITGAEMVEGEAYSLLQHLTDRIGPRLTGSAGAEAAVAWTAERLRSYGLAVRTEKVMVPHWVRGVEEAELVAPAPQRILVTALGGSEPTPAAGLTEGSQIVREIHAVVGLAPAAIGADIESGPVVNRSENRRRWPCLDCHICSRCRGGDADQCYETNGSQQKTLHCFSPFPSALRCPRQRVLQALH